MHANNGYLVIIKRMTITHAAQKSIRLPIGLVPPNGMSTTNSYLSEDRMKR